jgi:nucleoid DNA-binding protein
MISGLINNLLANIKDYLKAGYLVQLTDFGIFKVSKGKFTKSPTDPTKEEVFFKVSFKAAGKLKKSLKDVDNDGFAIKNNKRDTKGRDTGPK